MGLYLKVKSVEIELFKVICLWYVAFPELIVSIIDKNNGGVPAV